MRASSGLRSPTPIAALVLLGSAAAALTVDVHLPPFGALVARREHALGRAVMPARARRNLALRDRELVDGRSMLVERANRFDVECVVRGYLAGSGWKEYQATGKVCGVPLPPGLQLSSPLPEPIFTPATKASEGHDENIDFDQMVSIVGGETAERLRALSLEIYRAAAAHVASCGLILADTKFEFGERDGEIIWIDEALSPDSSRYWPMDGYRVGESQESFDKQVIRDYLDSIRWDRNPPPPRLPEAVIEKAARRYEEALGRITGAGPTR